MTSEIEEKTVWTEAMQPLLDIDDGTKQEAVLGNPPFLTEGQRGFFEAKQRILDEITPATENETKLKKLAQFLLAQFRLLQVADNRRNEERAAEKKRMKEFFVNKNTRHSKMFGVMVSCYRALDRHFGDEIRAHLAHNFETEKQGRIKKAMEEIERISKGM